MRPMPVAHGLTLWILISFFPSRNDANEPEPKRHLPPNSVIAWIACSAEPGIASLVPTAQFTAALHSLENDPRFRTTDPLRAKTTLFPQPTENGVTLLKLEFSSAARQAETLKVELEAIAKEHESLLTDLTNFSRAQIQKRLASETDKVKQLEVALDTVDRDLNAADAAISNKVASDSEEAGISGNIASHEEVLKERRISNQQSEERLMEETKSLESLKRDSDNLSMETRQTLNADLARTRESLDKLKASIDEKRAFGKAVSPSKQQELDRLKKLEEQASRQLETLQQIEQTRDAIASLENQRQEESKEIANIEANIKQWTQRLDELKRTNTPSNETLQTNKTRLQRRREQLGRILDKKLDRLRELENRLGKLIEPAVEIIRYEVSDDGAR
ncbi:MAG: hypothetical protein U1D30_02980 [Planctomycetota bacterium]